MKRKWLRARKAELQFARALRKVAEKCGKLAQRTYDPARPMGSSKKLNAELQRYGQTLQGWAKATAHRMVVDVERKDESFWLERSKQMSRQLRADIKNSPMGPIIREQTQEAAALITSLPLEAAQRVERLSVEYMTKGIRASYLADQIMRTGQVTKSRAMTIARTETSRTVGIIQKTRAESVGSDGYIWRTSEDADVRDMHRKLEGKFFRWSAPPIAGSRGERAHPGCIYNCRCWAEVVLPGETVRARNRKQFVSTGNTRASQFRAEEVELAA